MHCRDCEYDLSGLPAGACPECGRAFDPADPSSFLTRPGAATPALWWLIGILAVLGTVPPVWALATASAPILVVLVVLVPGIVGLAAVVGGIQLTNRRLPRLVLAGALAPAAVTALLIVSLAGHMWLALGGWPTGLGTQVFPATLQWHASLAMDAFAVLLAIELFGWWWIAIVCAVIPTTRRAVLPLGLHGLASAACIGILLIMPDPFQHWWWD